jgi:phosphatidylinositol phospholipase C epsilon
MSKFCTLISLVYIQLIRIEAFRPLWLTITDEIPGFKFLTDAFNSNEKTPQYCDAVSRALDIPTCKVVPFFGTFLKDLRTILSTVPSIVVLCNRNTQKPIEVCIFKEID